MHDKLNRRFTKSLALTVPLLLLAGCATGPESESSAETGSLQSNEIVEIQQRLDAMAKLGALEAASAASDRPAVNAGAPSETPSAYGDRVRRKVKPNIVFSDRIAGNPAAIVSVRLAPDGTVLSRQLVQSSGYPKYDAAVLHAVDVSSPFPRTINGFAPPRLQLRFHPKEEGATASNLESIANEAKPKQVMLSAAQGSVTCTDPGPWYPQAARDLGAQGRVLLRIHLTDLGEPSNIEVVTSSGWKTLDESAVSAARTMRCEPFVDTKTDEPIAVVVTKPYQFVLDDMAPTVKSRTGQGSQASATLR